MAKHKSEHRYVMSYCSPRGKYRVENKVESFICIFFPCLRGWAVSLTMGSDRMMHKGRYAGFNGFSVDLA